VMLPEYLGDFVPLAGRGMGILEVTIRREGTPMHEVFRPAGLPDVVGAGAELVRRLQALHTVVSAVSAPYAGHDSVFVGQIQAGEIYNQAPVECLVKGTRRWTTPGGETAVRAELDALLRQLAEDTGTEVAYTFQVQGDALRLDPAAPIVGAFEVAYQAVTGGTLPYGAKPFVDDGNTFAGLGGIPALTHGPVATGAHTLNEMCPVAELVRVAQVYALTAISYCDNT
jgi:acetylornithine deacetylase/succinyl-diaminopimelate desuccinylase-like protein